MKAVSLVLLVLLCGTACVPMTQGYWKPPDRADLNRQQDDLECRAMAAQAATGAGAWSSDPAIRAGAFASERDRYYVQCVTSRGYTWVPPR